MLNAVSQIRPHKRVNGTKKAVTEKCCLFMDLYVVGNDKGEFCAALTRR